MDVITTANNVNITNFPLSWNGLSYRRRVSYNSNTADPLRWRHNERDGVSNHRRLGGLQPFVQTQIKENIKSPRQWPLWGEFTGDRWIPLTKASNAENVSVRWRHHAYACTLTCEILINYVSVVVLYQWYLKQCWINERIIFMNT